MNTNTDPESEFSYSL
uniref:Uncharacterized protein n=1 Tax=Anguilla anguilla TaxID=7936 RepID=A0A0E9T1M1_ANGAN